MTGDVVEHRVAEGQSLKTIGARLGVDPRALARANGLRLDERLAPGTEIDVPAMHVVPVKAADGIVVNLPQRMLYLFEGGRLERSWPVAVGGSRWRTPAGRFKVIEMEVDPSWEVPPSIQAEMRRKGQRVRTRVPPGPNNPLGARWIGLSIGNIGIHGTNQPASIYRFATHGCIRMHPDDVEELFERVGVGTPVEIVYEPVLLTVDDGKVWLEAHPDAYARTRDPLGVARARAEALNVAHLVDWTAVKDALKARDGVPRVVGDEDRPHPAD